MTIATPSKFPELPPGFIAVPKGGRPKSEARDAAVFLAKFWRMEKHNETATKAIEWIVEKWKHKGISEAAHARSAIRRARDRGLNQSILTIFDPTGICNAVECEKTADGVALKDGARSWHWMDGMLDAAQGKVKNPQISVQQTYLEKSLISKAIASVMRANL